MQLRHIGSYIFEGHMGAIADIQGRQMYKKQHGVNPSRKNPPKDASGKPQFPGAPPPPVKKKGSKKGAEAVGQELFPLTPVPEWKKKEMKEKDEEAKKKNEPAVASVGPKVVSG